MQIYANLCRQRTCRHAYAGKRCVIGKTVYSRTREAQSSYIFCKTPINGQQYCALPASVQYLKRLCTCDSSKNDQCTNNQTVLSLLRSYYDSVVCRSYEEMSDNERLYLLQTIWMCSIWWLGSEQYTRRFMKSERCTSKVSHAATERRGSTMTALLAPGLKSSFGRVSLLLAWKNSFSSEATAFSRATAVT